MSRDIIVSRQKIYNSLVKIKEIYGSLEHLCLYVGYLPKKGISLHVNYDYMIDKAWLNKETIDVSHCLDCRNLFDMSESIAISVETWIKNHAYRIEEDDYYE